MEAVFQQQVPHIQRVKFREPNPFVEPEQVGNDVAHEHSGVAYWVWGWGWVWFKGEGGRRKGKRDCVGKCASLFARCVRLVQTVEISTWFYQARAYLKRKDSDRGEKAGVEAHLYGPRMHLKSH